MQLKERQDWSIYTVDDIRGFVNTTSKTEYRNGSSHYTLITTIENVLDINIQENLRIGYSNRESAKKATRVHRDIISSFKDNKQRFIQKHSGFTVLCDKFTREKNARGEFLYLYNASLVNGAQTQQLVKDYIEENPDDIAARKTEVRVEIIVERNQNQRINIAIARNNSVNVQSISKLGKQGYFDHLEDGVKKILGENAEIQKSETQKAIETEKLIQVVKIMCPHKLNPKLRDAPHKVYCNRKSNVTEYQKMVDNNGKDNPELFEFYNSFCGVAWREYKKWSTMPEWVKVRNRHENYYKLGNYNEKDNTIEIRLSIVLPLLYGLTPFIKKVNNAWKIVYPENFDAKKYIKYIAKLYKDNGCDANDFGRNQQIYLNLFVYNTDML